jgi:ligand-binding sensor domain-containing protein
MIRLLLSILLCYCLIVKAQPNSQYIFRHIDQQDGLLHNSVYAIIQDQQGFMWIGTSNGLQRYDGLRFKNYEKELMKLSYSIPIKNIYDDKQNNLWVTSTQLAKINISKDSAVIYEENDLLKDPEEKFVTYIDEQKHKWLLGKYCLFYADSLAGTMNLFGLYTPFQSSKLGNTIYHDSLRRCTWVIGFNNLMMFDEKTKNIYTSSFNPANNPVLKAFAGRAVSFFLLDRNENIWAAEWGSTVYKFNGRNERCLQYQTVHKSFKKNRSAKKQESVATIYIYEDSHGTIWVGNDHNGLFRYNADADSLEIISGKNIDQKGLQYNYNFQCMTEDRDGNLWLGTDRGINIFNPYNQYFSSITHEETNPSSLPKNEITSFIQDHNGWSYVGTWGGGFSIYDTTGHFKKTVFPKGLYEYPLVWSFAENVDGTIWVGAQHGYIHIYHPLTGEIKTLHPAQADNSTVRCMVKDSVGNMWIGLHNGKLMEWERQPRSFVKQSNSGLLNNNSVKNIFIDHNNQIWVSTSTGLLQFDPASRQYIGRFLLSNNSLYSYCSDDINGVEQQNDSILLVATMRCGFFFFNMHSNIFTRYNGFPEARATNIYAIKKDSEQNLWMTSDYHIYQLRDRDKKLIKYDLPAGLMNASFEMCNIYALQNGNWLSASKTEAIIFNPVKIASNRARYSSVQITGFKVYDHEINIDSIYSGDKIIRLNSDQNFITIEFTNQSYGGIAKNIFYKLSGIDRNWVKATEKGVASYTNLEPGDYNFIIKAGEEDSNSPETNLSILITPPFYSMWWFKILAILFIVFVIYAFLKRRIQNIRYKAELRHKISETEMLALRSQMNPHFIFNCLSAIDNLIQTNQPDKATTYLARFAKLIRSLLESTKHNLVPFYKDFETLQLYIELEQFRSGNKFSYSMVADDELIEGDYKVPPLLVQPFVENAIHHGLMNKLTGERNLVVKASIKAGSIQYLVKDDGVGRTKAQEIKQQNKPEHNSYGIEISSQRIQLHNKNGKQNNIIITDLSCNGQPSGTEVAVNIQIDNP